MTNPITMSSPRAWGLISIIPHSKEPELLGEMVDSSSWEECVQCKLKKIFSFHKARQQSMTFRVVSKDPVSNEETSLAKYVTYKFHIRIINTMD